MNYCHRIRKCPASQYLSCEAYAKGTNCWEIAEKPCCKRRTFDRCEECWVYQAFLSEKTTGAEPAVQNESS